MKNSVAPGVLRRVRGHRHDGGAGASRRRRRVEECRRKRRVADLRPDSGRNALQPAQPDQRRATSAGSGWRGPTTSGRAAADQEATPLVWNGTLYGITNWSVVFAVDARTGKERWRWDPEVNQTAVRPKICCGVVNRGIAIYDGQDHRAGHRRPAAGARRGNRQGGVGSARRVSAGSLHDHDGAAHRQGQGDHRRRAAATSRRADSSTPTTRRPDVARGASTPFPAIRRSRSKTPR